MAAVRLPRRPAAGRPRGRAALRRGGARRPCAGCRARRGLRRASTPTRRHPRYGEDHDQVDPFDVSVGRKSQQDAPPVWTAAICTRSSAGSRTAARRRAPPHGEPGERVGQRGVHRAPLVGLPHRAPARSPPGAVSADAEDDPRARRDRQRPPAPRSTLREKARSRLDPCTGTSARAARARSTSLAENDRAFRRLRPAAQGAARQRGAGHRRRPAGRPARGARVRRPTAFHRLAHPDGELATARAAAAEGAVLVTCDGRDDRGAPRSSPRPGRSAQDAAVWFQLYLQPRSAR